MQAKQGQAGRTFTHPAAAEGAAEARQLKQDLTGLVLENSRHLKALTDAQEKIEQLRAELAELRARNRVLQRRLALKRGVTRSLARLLQAIRRLGKTVRRPTIAGKTGQRSR